MSRTDAKREPDRQPNHSSSIGSLLLALVPIVLVTMVGLIAWQFLPTDDSQTPLSDRKPVNIGGVPEVSDSRMDEVQELTDSFAEVLTGFQNLDQTNIQSQIEKIEELASSLESASWDDFSEENRAEVSSRVSSFRQSLLHSLTNIGEPEIKDQIQPLVDTLLNRLQSLGF